MHQIPWYTKQMSQIEIDRDWCIITYLPHQTNIYFSTSYLFTPSLLANKKTYKQPAEPIPPPIQQQLEAFPSFAAHLITWTSLARTLRRKVTTPTQQRNRKGRGKAVTTTLSRFQGLEDVVELGAVPLHLLKNGCGLKERTQRCFLDGDYRRYT